MHYRKFQRCDPRIRLSWCARVNIGSRQEELISRSAVVDVPYEALAIYQAIQTQIQKFGKRIKTLAQMARQEPE